jgi:benzoyl-CoA reductase/2-hydroxyglutaryl-CoA dehydratase subunit BcrC/BadD/HgdB
MMRQATKKENIPFLSIKTDFGQEDIGQLKTRVEAFLEVLTAQNK